MIGPPITHRSVGVKMNRSPRRTQQPLASSYQPSPGAPSAFATAASSSAPSSSLTLCFMASTLRRRFVPHRLKRFQLPARERAAAGQRLLDRVDERAVPVAQPRLALLAVLDHHHGVVLARGHAAALLHGQPSTTASGLILLRSMRSRAGVRSIARAAWGTDGS